MATVNFSVPETIKQAFNDIADLMRDAVERTQRRQRHVDAIDRILKRRQHAPRLTEEALRSARESGRP